VIDYLLLITNAAMTPGTHPTKVRMVVIRIDPHPLSSTAKGGNNTHNRTLQILMIFSFLYILSSIIDNLFYIRNYNVLVSDWMILLEYRVYIDAYFFLELITIDK
jgi:hypothetical protein